MTGHLDRDANALHGERARGSGGNRVYFVTLVLIAAVSLLIFLGTLAMVRRISPTGAVSGHDIRRFSHMVAYLTLATFVILILEAILVYRPLARQRQSAMETLEETTTTDPLTAILNRSAFLATLELELRRGQRIRQPLCLLIADIDRFHFLNDRFGAAAGDVVLKHFAASAQLTLRAGDVLGRLGGEEFAVLLPSTDLAGGELAAERIRDSFAGTTAAVISDGQRVTATVSIGVVCTLGTTISEALEEADALLIRAKAAGRNRVQTGSLVRDTAPAISPSLERL